ncbi:LPXTG-motif protein cell wall anchor domain protein [Cooperia oncophora]
MSIAQTGLSTTNSYIFGTLAIILNTFLIFVIRKKATHIYGSYKHMMTAYAAFDLVFSAVDVVCSPRQVYLYFDICKYASPVCSHKTNYLQYHQRRSFYLATLPFAFSTSICAMICFAAWPTQSDLDEFTGIAYDINVEGNYTFLVATLQARILEVLAASSKAAPETIRRHIRNELSHFIFLEMVPLTLLTRSKLDDCLR